MKIKNEKCKMKNLGKVFLLLPLFLSAESFSDIQKDVINSLTYKMAKEKIKIFKKKLEIVKSKNYGSVDVKYSYAHLFNQPILKMNTMQPVAVNPVTNLFIYKEIYTEFPAGPQNIYSFEAIYSYPIFTGFAISNNIKKSKLELIKTKLEAKNVKRVLILKAAELYSNIYALNKQIKALKVAKNSLLDAKNQVESLYKEGLTAKSNVDIINAKYYELLAKIKEVKSQKNRLLNMLSFLLNKKITKIDGVNIKQKLPKPNFEKRVDVKALKTALNISNKDIKLAKSLLYPKVGLQIGLKKEAQNLLLSKNDYQNIDRSFVGVGIEWSFDLGKKSQIEMAKIAKNIALTNYHNYLNQIKTEYQNDLDTLNALKYQLKSAIAEVSARKSYYEEIKAKFNQGLVDSVKLKDAISNLAIARAKRDYIKSQIFFIKTKLILNSGVSDANN
ncbi:TolC family protein [Caminibacter mediatlanticus]|uniref:Outer membrane component of efflux system n=1 Tax=Caminibacter mediatlanticus TB-2 TaxID=391592 RepID=A0AAI9AG35_9BACT|nr:TolC family protein [Caminibacter mediatlanticus]EDM22981.1 putative outer membrane component of efflux system [Caminibacter mediatlanticus TB-2]